MKKSEAIDFFGSGAGLGRAVGLTRSRISQWSQELTQKQSDMVTGAAMRLGKMRPTGTKGDSDVAGPNSKKHTNG